MANFTWISEGWVEGWLGMANKLASLPIWQCLQFLSEKSTCWTEKMQPILAKVLLK